MSTKQCGHNPFTGGKTYHAEAASHVSRSPPSPRPPARSGDLTRLDNWAVLHPAHPCSPPRAETARQYALADRARELGRWSRCRS
jgi:hypothetical protein